MESEQQQNFNERLSQWVANQGFWFQIRYSMTVSGIKGRAMFHVLRIGLRMLVFVLLVAIGILVFLLKRTDSERFSLTLREDLKSALSASDLEMRGGSRIQGQFEISRLAAEGGGDTFFTSMEARNIRCKMGLLDGMVGIWQPGVISIAMLNLDLRAGTDDAESARRFSEALFRKADKIEANVFEVADATLHWGYSDRTQGAIESSALTMQRTETGWKMSFKGGWFSQNWLNKLEIVNLVVNCDANGLVFERAELKTKDGTVDLSGVRVIGGERPQVQGVVKVRGINLENVLPIALRSFVEGSISGDFKVSGSTNSSDGIGFEGQVTLDGQTVITLRDRIHLLKALTVVGISTHFRRADFREGSFVMKSIRGGLELSEVKLKAEDLLTLEGKMTVRLPTQEEIRAAVEKGSNTDNSPLYASENEAVIARELPKAESEFSLKRAAQEAKRIKEGSQSIDSLTLFDRLGLSIEMRRLQNQESERMSRMLRYEGMFRITISGNLFERAPRLLALYPADPNSGRITLQVPIEGNLYDITLKQAEDIYEMGRR